MEAQQSSMPASAITHWAFDQRRYRRDVPTLTDHNDGLARGIAPDHNDLSALPGADEAFALPDSSKEKG